MSTEYIADEESTSPRVTACIAEVAARFPGEGKAQMARYFDEVHQHLAPLARELERELAAAKANMQAMGQTRASQPVAAIPEARQRVPTCAWTLDERDESSVWDSACGERWVFNDGGPKENDVRFCHGCGKPVLASMSADAQSKGAMICPQCGVNRLKLPCPGMADECAMKADAHLAPAVQAGTAQGSSDA